jgi:hypothetical protein
LRSETNLEMARARAEGAAQRTGPAPADRRPHAGQGLPAQSAADARANAAAHAELLQQYAAAKAWRAAFKADPAAACPPARPGAAACPGVSDAVLSLAAAPPAFSSLDASPPILGPARDQRPCLACAAFAVAGAAEAAAARGSGRGAAEVGALSAADLFFCGPLERGCFDSWSIPDALASLTARALLLDRCLPFDGPAAAGGAPRRELCAARCGDTSPVAALGTWRAARLPGGAAAQQHILRHGAAVTRFEVHDDFAPFFAAGAGRRGVVYSPAPGAKVVEHHAVLLVGYDNERRFWLARNSWGPGFADAGTFKVSPRAWRPGRCGARRAPARRVPRTTRPSVPPPQVAFGAAGVLSPNDTYGLAWRPVKGARPPLATAAAPGRPSCMVYEVRVLSAAPCHLGPGGRARAADGPSACWAGTLQSLQPTHPLCPVAA